MSNDERHTIDELLARYELEPTLKDVYVEGQFDREILARHFETVDADFVFYEIGSVEIPASLLIGQGLSEGNKQRVILLSRELARIQGDLNYRCLIDRDLDHWFGELEAVPRLIWTQYCSIELYFLTKELLFDLLVWAAKIKVVDFDVFLHSFKSVLVVLYTMRLADRELGWAMDWIEAYKCLRIDGSGLLFDQEEFVNRLLAKNAKGRLKEEFLVKMEGWKIRLDGDVRLFIRGHDFIELLAWSVGKCKGLKPFASAESFQRLFVLLAQKVTELSTILD